LTSTFVCRSERRVSPSRFIAASAIELVAAIEGTGAEHKKHKTSTQKAQAKQTVLFFCFLCFANVFLSSIPDFF
jgi:hypothetical protein